MEDQSDIRAANEGCRTSSSMMSCVMSRIMSNIMSSMSRLEFGKRTYGTVLNSNWDSCLESSCFLLATPRVAQATLVTTTQTI